MKKNILITALLLCMFFFTNCTDKISYSGKILNQTIELNNNINSKDEIINILGTPSFIDPIEKKYFYFTEKKITKNFFEKKTVERELIVIKFDKSDFVTSINKFNLSDQNQIEIITQETPNELIKQGLLEKIFGGVGKGPVTP